MNNVNYLNTSINISTYDIVDRFLSQFLSIAVRSSPPVGAGLHRENRSSGTVEG